MPPASAKAIASLICLRSKYLSRIGTDRTVGAKLARPLRMLRPQREVAGADAPSRVAHVLLDRGVVGRDVVQHPTAHVGEDQPRIAAAGQQAASRGNAVDAQLQRVRLDECGVESRVGLEIDQRRTAVDFADAVDEPAHPRRADATVADSGCARAQLRISAKWS